MTADTSETSAAADRKYPVDPAPAQRARSRRRDRPIGRRGRGESTRRSAADGVASASAPLEAQRSPTTSPLEAQSLPVGTPMQAQTPPTRQQAQSSRTATATPATTFTNTVQVIYWMPSVTASVVQGSAGWSDNLFGLDYRLEAQSHWGIHLVGVTGNENGYTLNGTSLASLPLSGNDALWSADLFYRWYFVDPTADKTYMFGLFTGYGGRSINLNTNALGLGSVSGSSNGIRFGLEGAFQISRRLGDQRQRSVRAVRHPGGQPVQRVRGRRERSVSATGQRWDYLASVSYHHPEPVGVHAGVLVEPGQPRSCVGERRRRVPVLGDMAGSLSDRPTSHVAPAFWKERVKKRQLDLESVMNYGLDEVVDKIIQKEIWSIRRNESLIKKANLLLAICKPSATDPDYTFDEERMKAIDKLRQDVVHGDLLGSEIADVDMKLTYLRDTWMYFFKMMHKTFGLRIDTTVFTSQPEAKDA